MDACFTGSSEPLPCCLHPLLRCPALMWPSVLCLLLQGVGTAFSTQLSCDPEAGFFVILIDVSVTFLKFTLLKYTVVVSVYSQGCTAITTNSRTFRHPISSHTPLSPPPGPCDHISSVSGFARSRHFIEMELQHLWPLSLASLAPGRLLWAAQRHGKRQTAGNRLGPKDRLSV